ncbi:S41 family peptidase [Mariniflexile gromovii]|uniref:Peptidase S41 n=1 Tax=Mariniflexile gromovii TaxID=362523 RepID=A0ABS4BU53_9FLAO|nr:S41 family peptidase [Mariniflexile gromovii]MBP0903595.1 peptidase S41 [Mariniflexile gromovii]
MKKQGLLLIVLMLLMSCGSIKKYNEHITQLHSVEDLRRDVDKVYKQLQQNHPKLYQYTTKEVLDFKFDSLKTAITAPITSRDFYKKLSPVVAQIKQGHISLGSVSKRYTKKEKKALKTRKFEFYDLDFEYLDDKLWVVGTKGKDSTVIGNEVFKIDNELATDLAKQYKTQFASDGYNQTLHNRALGNSFSIFYYKDKGFLDSLKIEFKQKDSLFTKTFRRILKDDKVKKNDSIARIVAKKSTKEEKQQNRLEAKKKRKEHKKRGYIASKKEYTRNFDFIGTDSAVAYMKIRAFSNGNYKKFYKESFKVLDSLKTKNLILDLRDNGGGRIAEVDYLYSYLTDNEYVFLAPVEVNSRFPYLKYLLSNGNPTVLKVFGVLSTIEPATLAFQYLKTKKKDGKIYFKMKYNKIRKPKNLNYKGQLYVITNGNSFSASSLLSTHLKANNRAVFVGEETGGAYNGCVAGIYKIYEMPTSKLKIRMGLMQIEAPYKQTPDGYGVKPDIEILPNIEDRNLHKDPELDWILNTINTNEKL